LNVDPADSILSQNRRNLEFCDSHLRFRQVLTVFIGRCGQLSNLLVLTSTFELSGHL